MEPRERDIAAWLTEVKLNTALQTDRIQRRLSLALDRITVLSNLRQAGQRWRRAGLQLKLGYTDIGP